MPKLTKTVEMSPHKWEALRVLMREASAALFSHTDHMLMDFECIGEVGCRLLHEDVVEHLNVEDPISYDEENNPTLFDPDSLLEMLIREIERQLEGQPDRQTDS